jgi:hypothetical protein
MHQGTSMLIEDVACPVDKLPDMMEDLVEMFTRSEPLRPYHLSYYYLLLCPVMTHHLNYCC